MGTGRKNLSVFLWKILRYLLLHKVKDRWGAIGLLRGV